MDQPSGSLVAGRERAAGLLALVLQVGGAAGAVQRARAHIRLEGIARGDVQFQCIQFFHGFGGVEQVGVGHGKSPKE